MILREVALLAVFAGPHDAWAWGATGATAFSGLFKALPLNYK
jgi:hypothetical protein